VETGTGIAPLGGILRGSAAAEWTSLASESDPQLRAEGLLSLGARQENEGNFGAAAAVYASIADLPDTSSLQERARERLAVLQGGGSLGGRSEWLLRRLASEAADPSMLFAMGLAGTCFRLTRLGVLSRLAASPSANLFTRGLGARAVAGLAAFAFEAPTFSLSARLFHEATGREQDWSARALARDLASSYLTLGGLKLAGWASGAAYANFGGTLGLRARPLSAVFQQIFQQSGMFTGILLGHGLERWAGLRDPQPAGTTLIDSLAMLLQFHVAGNLGRSFMGEGFQSWERSLDSQTQGLSQFLPRFHTPLLETSPVLAGGHPASLAPRLFPEAGRFYSVAINGEGNGERLVPGSGSSGAQEASAEESSTIETYQHGGIEIEGEVPEPRPVEYPPEIDALFSQVEEQMRQPGYYEGTREELSRKRPDAEALDRIWFHQALDLFGRHSELKVREADVDLFLEPAAGVEHPDADLLQGALRSLGPRGRGSSSARRVLVVDYPALMLVNPFFGFGEGFQVNMEIVSTFGAVQKGFGGRVAFMPSFGENPTIQVRIPAPSLFEKVLQSVYGPRAVQIHWVDGTIPRDTSIDLRARKISPGGLWRNWAILGDIDRPVHPFANTVHDVVIHGSADARSQPRELEFCGQLYRWSQRQLPSTEMVEKMRNELADGNLAGAINPVHTVFSSALELFAQARP